MVDEREDEIERLLHDGHVHRWSKRSSAWPGHTTFVVLRGGQVVLGDRYAGEGIERTYACELPALLEGCFQELVGQQLGAQVLAELLAEVRRELGVPATTGASPKGAGPSTKNAHEPATSAAARTTSPPVATEAGKPAVAAPGASAPVAPAAVVPAAVAPVPAPAPGPSPSKAVSAPSTPRSAAAASERPSTPASTATSTTVEPTSAARVDVTLVACPGVSLPLAVALRGITRTPVRELLGRLRSLPCRVAAGVPREQAEGLMARLAELGAEVRLVPAGGS